MPRGRPPKPTKLLELSGAFKKDPQRKRARQNEPVPKGQIRDYPGDMADATQEDIYKLILETAPDGVVTDTDFLPIWNLARLQHRVCQGIAKVAELQALMAGLGRLGMNPSDRARMQLGTQEKPKNRWASK